MIRKSKSCQIYLKIFIPVNDLKIVNATNLRKCSYSIQLILMEIISKVFRTKEIQIQGDRSTKKKPWHVETGTQVNVIPLRECRQLGFITLNANLSVDLKPTHPPLLNGKGQFTFLKIKSSHPSGTVVYPPKFEFLRN